MYCLYMLVDCFLVIRFVENWMTSLQQQVYINMFTNESLLFIIERLIETSFYVLC